MISGGIVKTPQSVVRVLMPAPLGVIGCLFAAACSDDLLAIWHPVASNCYIHDDAAEIHDHGKNYINEGVLEI
jgi:hypothetical protein